MLRRLGLLSAILASLALMTPGAQAHPHVWITMQSEVVYSPEGTVTGVRHAWTFDDMFSAYALQGIQNKAKGVFTREELAPLAEENVMALKEYNYFTRARVDGKKVPFVEPIDYWLDYADSTLTLHFTLPLKTPVQAKNLFLEIYDPEFFVNFEFGEKNPVTLAGAPAKCSVNASKPDTSMFPSSQRLDKNFQASEAFAGTGARYANKIEVTCP